MMRPVQEVKVTGCGVCSRTFLSREALREHARQPDADGDTHEGEPWFGHTLRAGQVWRWMPGTTGEQRTTSDGGEPARCQPSGDAQEVIPSFHQRDDRRHPEAPMPRRTATKADSAEMQTQ